jgi:hypothetical protein
MTLFAAPKIAQTNYDGGWECEGPHRYHKLSGSAGRNGVVRALLTRCIEGRSRIVRSEIKTHAGAQGEILRDCF